MGRFFLLFLFVFGFSLSAEIIESKDIRDVLPVIQRLSEEYGADQVLFVADYDNSLAETTSALGGEPWFEALTEERGPTSYRDVILLQRAIFQAIPGRAVQPETADVIRQIQKGGVRTMVLTSRNRQFASVTLADLTRMKINFAARTIEHRGIPTRAFSLINDFDRKVLFTGGAFFTAGLPKGSALRNLLSLAQWRPKAIVFLDDRLGHTQSVEQTLGFPGSDIEVVAFRYGATDQKTAAERASESARHHATLTPYVESVRALIRAKHAGCHALLNEIEKLASGPG